MASSVGAKAVLATRSLNIQKAAPHRKDAGMITRGFEVFISIFETWGTAIPTKEIGPAKAVTVAESRLESIISIHLKSLI